MCQGTYGKYPSRTKRSLIATTKLMLFCSPGRWHVASTMKLLAVIVLQRYECKIEDTKDMNFEWRDALVPNPKTILSMKMAQDKILI